MACSSSDYALSVDVSSEAWLPSAVFYSVWLRLFSSRRPSAYGLGAGPLLKASWEWVVWITPLAAHIRRLALELQAVHSDVLGPLLRGLVSLRSLTVCRVTAANAG